MSLSFDPADLSVAKATQKLDELSLEELGVLREVELAGKNRITLLTAIAEAASDFVDEQEEDAEEDSEASQDDAPAADSDPAVEDPAEAPRPRFTQIVDWP